MIFYERKCCNEGNDHRMYCLVIILTQKSNFLANNKHFYKYKVVSFASTL